MTARGAKLRLWYVCFGYLVNASAFLQDGRFPRIIFVAVFVLILLGRVLRPRFTADEPALRTTLPATGVLLA